MSWLTIPFVSIEPVDSIVTNLMFILSVKVLLNFHPNFKCYMHLMCFKILFFILSSQPVMLQGSKYTFNTIIVLDVA